MGNILLCWLEKLIEENESIYKNMHSNIFPLIPKS